MLIHRSLLALIGAQLFPFDAGLVDADGGLTQDERAHHILVGHAHVVENHKHFLTGGQLIVVILQMAHKVGMLQLIVTNEVNKVLLLPFQGVAAANNLLVEPLAGSQQFLVFLLIACHVAAQPFQFLSLLLVLLLQLLYR